MTIGKSFCRRGTQAGLLRTEWGFTLVEIIVAVAIVGILITLEIPSYSQYVNMARVDRCIAEVRQLELEINAYSASNGVLPATLTDINEGSLLDPYGNPYQYLDIADADIKGKGKLRKDRFLNPLNTDFDLYSMGADGQSQTALTAKQSQDDIVRASNGAYVGLASNF